jgi:hypothetical protein
MKRRRKSIILLEIIHDLATSSRFSLFVVLAMLFFNYLETGLCVSHLELDERSVERTFPPNDHDLFRLLSKPENAGKTGELFVGIVNGQEPMISKESLLKLVEIKQNSISDFRCRYTVFEEEFDTVLNSVVSRKTSYEYAVSRNKLYLSYEYISGGDGRESSTIRSYDGEQIITLLVYPDGHLHVGIRAPDSDVLMSLFRGSMPLSLARLFDPRLCGLSGIDWWESNLMLFQQSGRLYGIFEKDEMVDGRQCLVVADLMSRFYLDPQRDFSVVQSEGYRLEYSDTGHLVGRRLGARSKLFDLRDHGNGIWIPYRAVSEDFDSSGNVTHRSTIDVSHVEINKGLDDDFFTGFVPDDTPVADTITGLAYLYGERPSINDLLKATAKSKRVFIFQYISVTAGVIMIIIALIMMYLKRRKRSE